MLFIIKDAKDTLIYYQYKMSQYNILNIKFFNSHINERKLGIQNGTEVTLKLIIIIVTFEVSKRFCRLFLIYHKIIKNSVALNRAIRRIFR